MSQFWSTLGPILAGTLNRHLGESVTYTPKGGVAKAINAIVTRDPVQYAGANGQVVALPRSIEVLADATLGVATVNVGGDMVALKENVGDTANKTYTVRRIIDQTGGRWLLGLN